MVGGSPSMVGGSPSMVGGSPSTANTGLTTANTGPTTANTGLTTANTGLTTANTGLTTANTGLTTANTGPTTANTGPTTANTGPTTANTGPTTANTGLTTANTGPTTALSGPRSALGEVLGGSTPVARPLGSALGRGTETADVMRHALELSTGVVAHRAPRPAPRSCCGRPCSPCTRTRARPRFLAGSGTDTGTGHASLVNRHWRHGGPLPRRRWAPNPPSLRRWPCRQPSANLQSPHRLPHCDCARSRCDPSARGPAACTVAAVVEPGVDGAVAADDEVVVTTVAVDVREADAVARTQTGGNAPSRAPACAACRVAALVDPCIHLAALAHDEVVVAAAGAGAIAYSGEAV